MYLSPGAVTGPTQAELRIDVLETAVRLLHAEHVLRASERGEHVGHMLGLCDLCRLVERALKP